VFFGHFSQVTKELIVILNTYPKGLKYYCYYGLKRLDFNEGIHVLGYLGVENDSWVDMSWIFHVTGRLTCLWVEVSIRSNVWLSLRRHSIRNYLVTDNRVHPCNWPDRVTANERWRSYVTCSSLTCKCTHQYLACTIFCACHCSVGSIEKTVLQCIRMFLFHSLII